MALGVSTIFIIIAGLIIGITYYIILDALAKKKTNNTKKEGDE